MTVPSAPTCLSQSACVSLRGFSDRARQPLRRSPRFESMGAQVSLESAYFLCSTHRIFRESGRKHRRDGHAPQLKHVPLAGSAPGKDARHCERNSIRPGSIGKTFPLSANVMHPEADFCTLCESLWKVCAVLAAGGGVSPRKATRTDPKISCLPNALPTAFSKRVVLVGFVVVRRVGN